MSAATNPGFPQQPRPTLKPSLGTRDIDAYGSAESIGRHFSIVFGGPVYDFLLRRGLVRLGLPNIARRIALLIAITWLTLLLLSLKDGLAWGSQVRIPFLYDFSMYGRFLLGLPLLLLAEMVIDPSIRLAVAEFVEARLVREQDLTTFDDVLGQMQRLRDSWIPEVILLVLAFFPTFLFQHEWMSGAASSWHTTSHGFNAATWWYAIVCTPLLRFIIYRWTFRYFIWTLLLWKVSRLNLDLMPTHPDHAAGLNFLCLTQKRFGILFCALGCLFAGRVANGMVFESAPISSFKFLVVGFIALSVIVGLIPLLTLVPKLSKVRRAGLIDYGRLAHSYAALFDRKWVHAVQNPSESVLGTGDIQSLADMGNSFAFVDAMTIAPVTKRLMLQLAGQAALPLVPVIILGTPLPELVHAIVKMLA